MRITDAAAELWQVHRRPVLISAGLLAALLTLSAGIALVLHAAGGATGATAAHPDQHAPPPAGTTPTATAGDIRFWNNRPPVHPSTSTAYPPITGTASRDPSLFARAFATELFTRTYAVDRGQLLAWAQYQDAPLQAPNYPQPDWSKVLVDALSDPTWDAAPDTPVPADGQWLALRAERATQKVSDVRVSFDQTWEQAVAGGFQPADPLATARDVTLTVTQHTTVSGHVVTKRFAVSIALQLGSSPHGGYGVAATNNYVIKEIG